MAIQQTDTSRMGLALSGGGFRASFFHLGVMARLAEMDALCGVEVISATGGGSILAAHYYLEVKKTAGSEGGWANRPRELPRNRQKGAGAIPSRDTAQHPR